VFFFEGRFIRIHLRFSTEEIRRKEERITGRRGAPENDKSWQCDQAEVCWHLYELIPHACVSDLSNH
jgi:hypothetical protein